MGQFGSGSGNPFGSLSRGDIVSGIVSIADMGYTFKGATSIVSSAGRWLATAGIVSDTTGAALSFTPVTNATIKNWVGGTVSVAGMTASALSLNPAGVVRGGIGLLSSVPVFYSDKSQSVLDWWIDRVSPF